MKSDKIEITIEQLETIEHYQRMYRLNSEEVEKLCSDEKADIVYGFVLGQMHSRLEDCFMGMMKLIEEIRVNYLNYNQDYENKTTF